MKTSVPAKLVVRLDALPEIITAIFKADDPERSTREFADAIGT